jgi:hypothetical protein
MSWQETILDISLLAVNWKKRIRITWMHDYADMNKTPIFEGFNGYLCKISTNGWPKNKTYCP